MTVKPHTVRGATRLGKQFAATKRNGSYKVADLLTCRGVPATGSLRKGIGRIWATVSGAKPAYAVESHYLLGVAATGNPLDSDFCLMRVRPARSGGILRLRKPRGFGRSQPGQFQHLTPYQVARKHFASGAAGTRLDFQDRHAKAGQFARTYFVSCGGPE